eukprot:jgi/Mesen1/1622/ME000135S00617
MGRRYVEVFRAKKGDYYNSIALEVAQEGGPLMAGGGGGGPMHHAHSPPEQLRSSGPPPQGRLPPGEGDLVEHTGVLKMRGLPFSATKQDVMEFFEGFELNENSIHIVTNNEGRNSGEAFVEFVTPDDARAAMSKDRCKIGPRYVELFPSSREEATRAATRMK